MREIKFRAWDKEQKKWRYDVAVTKESQYLIRTSNEFQQLVNNYYKSRGDILGGDYAEIDYTDWYAIHNIEINFYTGLKDKNGKDAYEDDIVDTWPFYKHQGNCKGKKRYQRIVFNSGMFGTENFDFGWEGEGTVRIEHCEIIGNIYENPELIK